MSTLQVSNLYFNSTANRLQFIGSNTVTLTTGETENLRIDKYQISCNAVVNVSGDINISNSITANTFNASNYLIKGQPIATYGTVIIRTLTSGTQYTTSSKCTRIYVEMVGGGGGGCSSTVYQFNHAGCAGGYCAKLFDVTPDTTYNYQIGSGGTASFGGSTNATTQAGGGGTTSFTVGGVTIYAYGGSGGSYAASPNPSGGGAAGGDINVRGNPSNSGYYFNSTGAPSYFGGAGYGGRYTYNDAQSGVNGSGGGANYGAASATQYCFAGNGGNGFIRVWEFT